MSRPFDRGTLNLTAYSHDDNESSSFVMEHTHMNASWYSRYGVHELCVKRGEASNALVLKRWDSVHNTPTKWSFLNFQTWEGQYSRAQRCRRAPLLTIVVVAWLTLLGELSRNGVVSLHISVSQGAKHSDHQGRPRGVQAPGRGTTLPSVSCPMVEMVPPESPPTNARFFFYPQEDSGRQVYPLLGCLQGRLYQGNTSARHGVGRRAEAVSCLDGVRYVSLSL